MKYVLLKTDGTVEILNPIAENGLSKYQAEEPGSMSLDYMYEKVGCDMIEHVHLTETTELWCDEEGLMKEGFVINPEATALYRAAYPHIAPAELVIVGNAILVDKSN